MNPVKESNKVDSSTLSKQEDNLLTETTDQFHIPNGGQSVHGDTVSLSHQGNEQDDISLTARISTSDTQTEVQSEKLKSQQTFTGIDEEEPLINISLKEDAEDDSVKENVSNISIDQSSDITRQVISIVE